MKPKVTTWSQKKVAVDLLKPVIEGLIKVESHLHSLEDLLGAAQNEGSSLDDSINEEDFNQLSAICKHLKEVILLGRKYA